MFVNIVSITLTQKLLHEFGLNVTIIIMNKLVKQVLYVIK